MNDEIYSSKRTKHLPGLSLGLFDFLHGFCYEDRIHVMVSV